MAQPGIVTSIMKLATRRCERKKREIESILKKHVMLSNNPTAGERTTIVYQMTICIHIYLHVGMHTYLHIQVSADLLSVKLKAASANKR